MPDAIITSTASTFGTISGTFAADQSTITGTVLGPVAGTLSGSVGVPGPGVPDGGLEGQILLKASDLPYDTVWADNYAATVQATVRNVTGATLTKGTVVYINGGAGNKPTVTKASASTEAGSSKTFAILAEDIETNQNGQAVTMGLLKGVDTSAFTAGANLWLSTTAGEITQTMPTTPAHAVFLGNVVRVHANQGEIEVRIQNGYELGELHDVLLDAPSNGQVLKYDAAQGLWINGTDVGGAAWGGITGTLSDQTDLQSELDGKYSTTNPAGYITSSALSPYLTSATAASTYYPLTNPSGYITSSALTGYATESWVTAGFYPLSGNPSGFLTSSSLTGYATESWVTSQGYLTSAPVTSVAGRTGAITLSTSDISGLGTLATVNDAPSDGSQYARKNGAWDVVSVPASYITSVSSPLSVTAGDLSVDLSAYLTTSAAASDYLSKAGNLAGLASTSTARSNLGLGTMATASASDYSTTTVANGLYYPLSSNPAGYLTSASLSGYATEAWVTSQGYLTSAPVTSVAGRTGAITLSTSDISGLGTMATATAADYSTKAVADTLYYPLSSNPAGYLTSAPVTSVAGKTGAVTLAVADVSGAAPTASPTFTGTPAAPTASAGTSTTQLATTAFVQQEVPAASTTAAGKVELATFVESTRFSSQTLATTPLSLMGLIAANSAPLRPRSSAFTAATSGTGASTQNYYTASIYSGPNASTVGYGGAYADTAGFWASTSAYTTPNWSKVTGFSVMAYRPSIGFVNGNTIRITLGKAASGGTLSTRGIGIDIAAANTYVKILAHNGTTLTTTDSTMLVSDYANLSTRNFTVVSYGNGTVELFMNGVSYGTSTGGPTTAGGSGTRYSEEVYGDGTQTSAMQLWTFNASVFTGL